MYRTTIGTITIMTVLSLFATPGRAATCDAGYYLDNGRCVECWGPHISMGYYCPGDDMAHYCPTDTLIADATATRPGTVDRTSVYTPAGLETNDDVTDCTGQVELHDDIASFTWVGKHDGTKYRLNWLAFSACAPGYYLSDHFFTNVDRVAYYNSLNKCDMALPPQTHYITPPDGDYSKCAYACDAGYYLDNDTCKQCENGYYCADGINRTKCPTNTSTHTAAATHPDDCDKLCDAGITQLHAGELRYHIWGDRHTTPALNIQTASGEICYINMAQGNKKDAINIYFNDKTYHIEN